MQSNRVRLGLLETLISVEKKGMQNLKEKIVEREKIVMNVKNNHVNEIESKVIGCKKRRN